MWKKILGVIVVLVVGMVGVTMYVTSGMTEVANEFFIHVKTKHYDDAYAMLSEDFRKSTPENTFKKFLIDNALTEYKSASWTDRSFENNMGKLEGTISTKSGGSIPLTINFIKGETGWKIYSIYKKPTGIMTEEKSAEKTASEKPEIPSKEAITAMTQESTLLFANAVKAKDMSGFYAKISKFWQEKTSVDELNKAFKPFMDAGIDFTVLKNLQPIFDKEPTLSEYNELIIEGHYPTTPSVAKFRNIYLKEDGAWKLTGFYMILKGKGE
jgi:hypothetical protein